MTSGIAFLPWQPRQGCCKIDMAEASAATPIHFSLPKSCEAAWEGLRPLMTHMLKLQMWSGSDMAEASAATTIHEHDGQNVYSSGGACLHKRELKQNE